MQVIQLKRKLYTFCLLSILFLSFSSFTHPLKVTASLIEYNSKEKNIRVECKVFIDDFLIDIGRDMNVSNLTQKDKSVIENYFKEFYEIKVNNRKIPFNYETSEVQESYNVLTIKFSKSDLVLKKGDKINIKNTLLFSAFGYLQSNRIELRFKPFFASKYVESTKVDNSFSYTF
ncbi:DUF6702 family protein [Tenacibaculum agarivorans]|uniref:DUF6702 family protein n=1 Tax=Tenacibaculum agarivorans TaxID=1908389 RepID=UPI00094B810D|nr:DUF6702 family protein [Tenacibaculum agarivorans]